MSHEVEKKFLERLHRECGVERFDPLSHKRLSLEDLKEKCRPLLDNLCLDHHRPVITIGGTNGKGETAYSLYDQLKNEGLHVCLWTSPHVLSVTERFVWNNRQATMDELECLWNMSKTWMERQQVAYLSFYERLWVMFLLGIQTYGKDFDVLILEVGVGGRLDAVNMIDTHVAVITSISRDHEELLGKSYRKILNEKLGIVKNRSFLVTSFLSTYLKELVEDWMMEHHRHHHPHDFSGDESFESKEKEKKWLDLIDEHYISETWSFSQRNRALAFWLRHYIIQNFFSQKRSSTVLLKKSSTLDLQTFLDHDQAFKARGELWERQKSSITFYGSHNRDGLREFFKLISGQKQKRRSYTHLLLSFSRRDDKELRELLQICKEGLESSSIKNMFFTTFSHPKACPLSVLKPLYQSVFLSLTYWWDDLETFWTDQHHLFEQEESHLLVAGSYYFIGTFQQLLHEKRWLENGKGLKSEDSLSSL